MCYIRDLVELQFNKYLSQDSIVTLLARCLSPITYSHSLYGFTFFCLSHVDNFLCRPVIVTSAVLAARLRVWRRRRVQRGDRLLAESTLTVETMILPEVTIPHMGTIPMESTILPDLSTILADVDITYYLAEAETWAENLVPAESSPIQEETESTNLLAESIELAESILLAESTIMTAESTILAESIRLSESTLLLNDVSQ